MIKESDIWEVVINMKERKISAYTEDGNAVKFPLSQMGGAEIKWTKVSAGGLIIQALIRMIVDRATDLR